MMSTAACWCHTRVHAARRREPRFRVLLGFWLMRIRFLCCAQFEHVLPLQSAALGACLLYYLASLDAAWLRTHRAVRSRATERRTVLCSLTRQR